MADGGGFGGGGGGGWDSRYAILAGHKVVPVASWEHWARWCMTANRAVGNTALGRTTVSTVFLGLDHGWDGKRLWFETARFDGRGMCDVLERYETWAEADAGHSEAVRNERASFYGWVADDEMPGKLERVLIATGGANVVVLSDGRPFPIHHVYRNRRRVPLRAATYQRRFKVTV